MQVLLPKMMKNTKSKKKLFPFRVYAIMVTEKGFYCFLYQR